MNERVGTLESKHWLNWDPTETVAQSLQIAMAKYCDSTHFKT